MLSRSFPEPSWVLSSQVRLLESDPFEEPRTGPARPTSLTGPSLRNPGLCDPNYIDFKEKVVQSYRVFQIVRPNLQTMFKIMIGTASPNYPQMGPRSMCAESGVS